MLIPLSDIRTEDGTQSRVATEFRVVQEYAEAMRAKASFPPVVVFGNEAPYWCADGFHRIRAALEIGLEAIEADVRQGGKQEAIWFSCGANVGHGIRRGNPDKRRAVEMAFGLRPDATNRLIAEHCGVSDALVADVRSTLLLESSNRGKARKGKDGKHYRSRGKKKAKGGKARAAKRKKDKEAAVASQPAPPKATPPTSVAYEKAMSACSALSDEHFDYLVEEQTAYRRSRAA